MPHISLIWQVGACIVNEDNKIVGIGYNGMPIGCSDDEFPWGKTAQSPIENKYMYGKFGIWWIIH